MKYDDRIQFINKHGSVHDDKHIEFYYNMTGHVSYSDVSTESCPKCNSELYKTKMTDGRWIYLCKNFINAMRLFSITHDGKENHWNKIKSDHRCNDKCEVKYDESGFIIGSNHSE